MSAPAHSRPFDLEAAKAGAPIGILNRNDAYFIAHVPEAALHSRVIFRLKDGDIGVRRENGKKHEGGDQPLNDLVMLPLGLIDGKPVFAADHIEQRDRHNESWVARDAQPEDRDFSTSRWPAPAKVYPQTQMSDAELLAAVEIEAQGVTARANNVANAALRHAIDAGQVFALPFDSVMHTHDLSSASVDSLIRNKLIELGWMPPEEKDARDMAIAVAVRDVACNEFSGPLSHIPSNTADLWIRNLDLAAIIASLDKSATGEKA